jgi:hypothetical protein
LYIIWMLPYAVPGFLAVSVALIVQDVPFASIAEQLLVWLKAFAPSFAMEVIVAGPVPSLLTLISMVELCPLAITPNFMDVGSASRRQNYICMRL